LECTPRQRLLVVELIRRHRPKLIITHPPRDYHLDHEMTSHIVEQAVLQCHNACVETDSPPCAAMPLLYYCDAWFVPFEPDEYVDIGAHMDLKLRMLACHRSQLPEHGSEEGDMLDLARLQSRYRGVEAAVRFAEAFRLAPRPGCVRKGYLSDHSV
jgi:LmbE family N-acetylglucosaminyl deacetylase